tara:strand:+ start:9718 stop:10134 length:417 start_codon:yes stop_codon:yes gene_type:complete
MNNTQQMKVGLWLGEKLNQAYERGKNDCCTLFMEYHDHMHGTNTLKSIYNKYTNKTGAIKTARKFKITEEWLPAQGYKQVDTPLTGDIVIVEQGLYPSGYIICMNLAWTNVDKKYRMQKFALEKPELPYSIWRHQSHE